MVLLALTENFSQQRRIFLGARGWMRICAAVTLVQGMLKN